MKQPTQEQFYEAARDKYADGAKAFLDAVAHGLTRNELEKLIAKRPEKYKRFEIWINRLP